MKWEVRLTKDAEKKAKKLPTNIRLRFLNLAKKMELFGPFMQSWSQSERAKYRNFGRLKGNQAWYHCHIKSGKPTYVVCWEVLDKQIRIVEVNYVGTHEKAPY